ncbi:hypothetical protein [Nocardia africana]
MLLPGQHVPSLEVAAHPEKTDIIVEDFDVFRYYLHRLREHQINRLGLAHLYNYDRGVIAAAVDDPVARYA